ncbi:hypothetical protein Trydic_g531 [Trypoxylus dichotomus]
MFIGDKCRVQSISVTQQIYRNRAYTVSQVRSKFVRTNKKWGTQDITYEHNECADILIWYESSAFKKPLCWYRYVYDTFVVWPHGADALGEFLQHLNSIHPRIQFPFLDVLVNRNRDGTLSHRVYRKPTHTDRYLHYNSNHHPKQKRAVIKTLVDRAARICEPQHIEQELQHLNQALQANGYGNPQIKGAMQPSNSKRSANEHQLSRDWQWTAYLAYLKSVTDRIGRTLERHNIRTIYKPTQQLRHQLRSLKDPRHPLTPTGVYRIPCSCRLVYIGTTKRSINTRLKEHKRNCRLSQTDKSANTLFRTGIITLILPIPRFCQQFRTTTSGYKERQ